MTKEDDCCSCNFDLERIKKAVELAYHYTYEDYVDFFNKFYKERE